MPPREGFHADDAAGPEIGLRLVVDLQLPFADRGLELGGQRETARAVAVVIGVVDLDAGVTIVLRVVHRDIGVLEQGRDVGAVRRRHRDADGRR